MAMMVTIVDEGRYVIELGYPELVWLRSISERCMWNDVTTLSTVVSHGLATMVILTKDLEQGTLQDEPDTGG